MDNQQLLNSAKTQANINTNQSQMNAREQMAFQQSSNAKAMQFSAEQAKINRDWQENMSNTSHQRQVKDLIKAGLNPILSAHQGSSTPGGSSASGVSSSGASGDVDKGATSVIGQLLSAVIGQATALETTSMSNLTALEQTKMMNETAIKTGQIGASAQLGTANINAKSNQLMQDKLQEFEKVMAQEFPQTAYGTYNAMKNQLTNPSTGSGKFINNIKEWAKGRLFKKKDGESW